MARALKVALSGVRAGGAHNRDRRLHVFLALLQRIHLVELDLVLRVAQLRPAEDAVRALALVATQGRS